MAVFSALEALKQELSAQHSAGYKRTADILALHETVREKSGQCIDSFFVLFLAPSEKKDAETAEDPQEKRIEALEHLLVFLKTTERDLVKDKMEREEGEEERDGRHEEDEEAEEPAGMHERSDTKTPAVLDKEKKDAERICGNRSGRCRDPFYRARKRLGKNESNRIFFRHHPLYHGWGIYFIRVSRRSAMVLGRTEDIF